METDFNNKMLLQLILTFAVMEQEIINYKFFDKEIFKSKDDFISWIKEQLTANENEQLIKVSTCIYNYGDFNIPNWYKECNGKFYQDSNKWYSQR